MNQISFLDYLLKIPTTDLLIISSGFISILYWCDFFESKLGKSIWFWIKFVFETIFIITILLLSGESPSRSERVESEYKPRRHHHHTEGGHIIKPDIIIDPSQFKR